MASIETYLSEEARAEIRSHIREAGGNEVFLVGHVDQDKVVTGVRLYARGNAFSTPALLQVAEPGEVVIHNHPGGRLDPSAADNEVASILGNDNIAFYIVNNEVTNIYVVIEPFGEQTTVPLQADLLAKLFVPGGRFSRNLENYEYRPQQVEMLRMVSRAINEDKIAVIEAGTGTGKTLAYLLPGIIYSLNNKKRIVVSTNTINLQEQLVNKDIPFLQSVLKQKFTAVLVKGRANYACKRKLSEARTAPDLFAEAEGLSEWDDILAWAKSTRDGSKSDLNFVPTPAVWEKIQSESDTSLKTECPFYQECFFYSARRKAAGAHLLVANHHLLFADLALRAAIGASENAILPTYERVILDEAHNIEDVATSYFGTRVTYHGTLRMLGKLHRVDKEMEKGLLPYLLHKLDRLKIRIHREAYTSIRRAIEDHGVAGVERLRLTLTAVMERIFEIVMASENGDGDAKQVKRRLTEHTSTSPEWSETVLKLAQKLVTEIRAFTARLSKIVEKIERFKHKLGQDGQTLTIDLQAQLMRLSDVAASIEHILLEYDAAEVRWLEVKTGYKETKLVRLVCCPLDVAPILKEAVFEKFKNVILTSATLTVEGRFTFLKTRLGLNLVAADRVYEAQLLAPFDYQRQVLVAIPTNIPAPTEPQFFDVLTNLVYDTIRVSRGRAFVLFTSYRLLNRIFFNLSRKITAIGHNVYKQGSENRHHLLERFRKDISSVLFATDSFWEGVDVHGEALECVIISKLPFKVPSEPIIAARVEAIERRGGNAFYEYTVPQAAIKFKQGFGRLIRRKTDRGAIVILDKRVVQKSYGQVFLKSLPACRMSIGPVEQVMQAVEDFYAGNS
ncbi:MAG: helicase C-terminal domain-containing protein [bacterium]